MTFLYKKIRVGRLGALFAAALIVFVQLGSIVHPQKAHAQNLVTPTGIATDFGIVIDNNGKVQNPPGFTLSWIDAADILVTWPVKGVSLVAKPKATGNSGKSALQDQRNHGVQFLGGTGSANYGVAGWPCEFNINFAGGATTPINKADVDIEYIPTPGASCTDLAIDAKNKNLQRGVSIANSELSVLYFEWVNQNTIQTVGGYYPGAFSRGSTDANSPLYNVFLSASDTNDATGCQDRIVVDPGSQTVRYFELKTSFSGKTPQEAGTTCPYNGNTSSYYAPPNNVSMNLLKQENNSKTPQPGDVAGSSNGQGVKPSCETTGFTLGWIFCGVINGLASLTQGIFNDVIEPRLKVTPVETGVLQADGTKNPIYQAWSAMRNIANLLLLFALLAIVFGQSIGGGVVDAYTAKKALPRILVAAIFVNLSLFFSAALIDVFNVVGGAIGELVVGPFKDTILQKINGNTTGASVVGGTIGLGGLVALFAVFIIGAATKGAFSTAASATDTGAASAGATAAFSAGSIASGFLHFFLTFVLVPAALIALAIFATLIIRQGAILLLMIVSPVAFALYALPNTEKYFKKWGEAFVETLMVYPIITLIFAVGTVLSAISYNANQNSGPLSSIIGALVALLILIIILALIPFGFKLAGGLIGNLMQVASGHGKRLTEAYKGDARDPNSRRNRAKRNAAASWTRARGNYVRNNENGNFSSAGGNIFQRGRRGFGGILAKGVGYGDLLGKEAALNEEGSKRVSQTTGYGDDTYVRARASIPLYQRAASLGGGETVNQDEAERDSVTGNALRAFDDQGNAKRLSLNGQKTFTDAQYRKSRSLYQTMGEMQEAVYYEGKKARDLEQAEAFMDNAGIWAAQEGLNEGQRFGLTQGVVFKNQGKRKEWKYTTLKNVTGPDGKVRTAVIRPHHTVNDPKLGTQFKAGTDASGNVVVSKTGESKADAFVDEAYTDMGSWAWSQEGDSTVEELFGRTKDNYAGAIRDMRANAPPPSASDEDKAVYNAKLTNLQEHLAKIQSMEDTLAGSPANPNARGGRPPVDDEGNPTGGGFSGLNGAPQAVQDTAKKHALRTINYMRRDENGKLVLDPKGNPQPVTEQVRRKYDKDGNPVRYDRGGFLL